MARAFKKGDLVRVQQSSPLLLAGHTLEVTGVGKEGQLFFFVVGSADVIGSFPVRLQQYLEKVHT